MCDKCNQLHKYPKTYVLYGSLAVLTMSEALVGRLHVTGEIQKDFGYNLEEYIRINTHIKYMEKFRLNKFSHNSFLN